MKKLMIIIPILFLMTINSCIIDRTPNYVNACFTITGTNHTVNDPVYFVNCSQYALSYEWSFGDGYTSNQRSPQHTYDLPGNYQVTMTAYGDYNYETFTDVVSIEGSTDLDIIVMFFGTTDPVSNCEVTIFDDLTDWENLNFNNQVVAGETNSNGQIIFRGLDPIVYYIDAYKNATGNYYYSNYNLGYATEALNEDEVNAYDIFVELLEETKRNDRNSFVIKKIEKRTAKIN